MTFATKLPAILQAIVQNVYVFATKLKQSLFPKRTNRYDDKVVGEDVHLLGPPADGAVAGVRQLGIEEGVEGVHLLVLPISAPRHDHLQIADMFT